MKRRDIALAVALTSKRAYKDSIGKPLARLRINLSRELEEIARRQSSEGTSELSKAYSKARNDMAAKFCSRDERGNPIQDSTGNFALSDPLAFEQACLARDAEFPDEKASFEQDQAALREWLDEDVPFHRPKGVEADFPKEASAQEYWALYMLLDCPED